MGQIVVTLRDGGEQSVAVDPGLSVMEALRTGGVDELLALCGGCCACATCHVHVDPEWIRRTGRAEGDEADLLSESGHCNDRSRLSCQIRFAPELEGLRVTVAPED